MDPEDQPALPDSFSDPLRKLQPFWVEVLAGLGCWLVAGLILAAGESLGQTWISAGGLLLYALGVSLLGYRVLLHLSLRLWKGFWIRLLLWPVQSLLGLLFLGLGLWLGRG
jgi:hypothetical protein